MLAASEASAEAAIQLPTIGADGWDDGLPRAVADRGSAGMMIVPMPALLQGYTHPQTLFIFLADRGCGDPPPRFGFAFERFRKRVFRKRASRAYLEFFPEI